MDLRRLIELLRRQEASVEVAGDLGTLEQEVLAVTTRADEAGPRVALVLEPAAGDVAAQETLLEALQEALRRGVPAVITEEPLDRLLSRLSDGGASGEQPGSLALVQVKSSRDAFRSLLEVFYGSAPPRLPVWCVTGPGRTGLAFLLHRCLAAWGLPAGLWADPLDSPPEPQEVRTVAFDPVVSDADSGRANVDILYRIRYDFFVFVHPHGDPSRYAASGDLTVEALDSAETSRGRSIVNLSLTTPDNTTAALQQEYAEGVVHLRLPPGRYTLAYHAEDHESNRIFNAERDRIVIPSYAPATFVRSGLVYVAPASDSVSRSWPALNFGRDVLFGKNAGALLQVKDLAQAPLLRYSLERIGPDPAKREPVQRDTLLSARLLPHSALGFEQVDPNGVLVKTDSSATSGVLYWILPTADLDQGRYEAKFFFNGADTARISAAFSLIWPDMPSSLRDLDFAIEAMKYIATDDEYSILDHGDRAERIRAFEAFWKKRDPTPGTAMNEVMTEYYRRVDYAYTQFRTIRTFNGALTDRGRTYILYGKPSQIQRFLDPGSAPREIWTYESLKKRFIFDDPGRQGNYRLTKIENP